MRVTHSVLSVVIPLLALTLSACGHSAASEEGAPHWRVEGQTVLATDGKPLAGVRTGVTTAAATAHVQIPGRLVWTEDSTARVFTPFNGRIEQILVEPGARVARNQPLLKLSSSDYGQAQAEASKADADLNVARRQFERAKDLLDAGVLAAKDFEQSEADLRHAQTESARTHSRLRSLGELRDDVDGTFVLRSPIAGVVVERAVNVGTEVRSDAPQPLYVITDPSRMTVLLDVPESLSGALSVGEEVVFSNSSEPERKGRARITHVAAEVDPLTQAVKARGVVLNQNLALRGESYIEASVPLTGTGAHSVRVPADALILVGDRYYLFAAQGARYRRVAVTVGVLGSDAVEVTSGLQPGQAIVLDGALYLEQLLEDAAQA